MSLVIPPFLQCRGAVVEGVLEGLPLRAQLAYSRWLLSPLMQICIVWDRGCWLLSSGQTSTCDLAKPAQLVTTDWLPVTELPRNLPLHDQTPALFKVDMHATIAFRFAPGSSFSTLTTCWYGLKFYLTAEASARVFSLSQCLSDTG